MTLRPALTLVLLVLVSACAGPLPKPNPPAQSPGASRPAGNTTVRPMRSPNDGRYSLTHDVAPEAHEIPPDVARLPDAVPVAEPRSASGNSPRYEVFGRTYRVLDDARGFRERGYASWYGKKFQGHKTASGEIYDMFKMSAAHKTLPLPSYVRVTRIDNGRSVVVRVNDRGPFHRGRIIDLSYAAAAKLDMLGTGSTEVEIVALEPDGNRTPPAPAITTRPAPATSVATSVASAATASAQPAEPAPMTTQAVAAPPDAERWLQVAIYRDPINAVAMREQLRRAGHANTWILTQDADSGKLHRVVLGPFADPDQIQSTRTQLEAQGYDAFVYSP